MKDGKCVEWDQHPLLFMYVTQVTPGKRREIGAVTNLSNLWLLGRDPAELCTAFSSRLRVNAPAVRSGFQRFTLPASPLLGTF